MVAPEVNKPQRIYIPVVISSNSKQDTPKEQHFKRFHNYPAKNLPALTNLEEPSFIEALESAVLESFENDPRIIRSIKNNSINFSIVSD